mgnify:CR=1 FL=1
MADKPRKGPAMYQRTPLVNQVVKAPPVKLAVKGLYFTPTAFLLKVLMFTMATFSVPAVAPWGNWYMGVPTAAAMSRVLVQVESAVFKDGNKWRISDGAATFYAAMDDMDFIDRIDAGLERFGKGDVLVVDLRRVQLITDNGLKSEWSIVKVHEHREPLQASLL